MLHLTIESVKINVLWNVNQHPSQKIRAVACTSGPIRGRLNWSENEVRLKYHAVALIRAAPEGTGYMPYDYLKTTGDHSGQQLRCLFCISLGFTGRKLGENYRLTLTKYQGAQGPRKWTLFTAPSQPVKTHKNLMPLAYYSQASAMALPLQTSKTPNCRCMPMPRSFSFLRVLGQKVTIRYNYDTWVLQSRYYLILHDPNLANWLQ